ncbi:sulfotransferase family protein [Salinibacter ruber]|uniref:sulfotransferase family protein n=1 Tax=Salinibacter ruber TaxID=146919 RepID=UPI0021673456|nr:sulfotransferase [Salinibacter ruber]MCS4185025.1 hypothetical protein [Salinibacter ruber]
MNFDGSNLIFIACQPRSGSTLLQRMLGGHPAVHTFSEPWIMLPPAYTLRDSGMDAEYDAQLARTGIRTFCENLPEGRDDYVEGIRRMYGFLYQRALETTEARLFLDKTPRYYLILSELKEIFPEARFILLLRNPLAVLSSILRTWVGKQWLKLSDYRSDLLKAPDLLQQMASDSESKVATIQYEELVRRPQSGIAALCEHLGIEVEPGITDYGGDDQEKWTFGDPDLVYEHSKPQTSSLEKWTRPENAQQWRLLHDYAIHLGKDMFGRTGYDYDECVSKLEASRPPSDVLRCTFSLNWLLKKTWTIANGGSTTRSKLLTITGNAVFPVLLNTS